MRVSVRLFTTLRELAGKREEMLDFDMETVRVIDALRDLAEKYGKQFEAYLFNDRDEVREHLQLLVNGRDVSLLEQNETLLREGDKVAIVPPVGGG